jgi:nucleotide-binding universal stress UspA family protein
MRLLALKTVLAAIDAAEGGVPVIEAAHRLATAAGAALHIVHVEGDDTLLPLEVAPTPAALRWLDAVLRDADVPVNQATVHVMRGDPARAIGLLADRIDAGVIVLGPHAETKNGSGDRLLGHTALAVVTNASAPCLLVTGPLRLPLERVVVPIDISDTARGALLVALSWASALRGSAAAGGGNPRTTTLSVLHVGSGSRLLDDELDEARRAAGNWAGLSIVGETIAGSDVARAIAAHATEHQADLVVLGTRGLGLDPTGRLGSTSAAFARLVRSPVLLVPPAVWIAHAPRSAPN